MLPVSPATVNLFDEIASDPSDAVTANFPLFTSTSPATSSVLDSVAAPELRLLNVVAPVTSSVPATTVLPVLPATVNLFDEIASDPSNAVTNFPLFTSTSPATSSVLDSVAPSSGAQRSRSRHVQRPATTVLPVLPATVNLFDEIASDPSDAVTANFPLFNVASTSSVLDSVVASRSTCSTVLDSSRGCSAGSSCSRPACSTASRSRPAQRSRSTSRPASPPPFARVASHRERSTKSPATRPMPSPDFLFRIHVACHISVLDSVAAPELRLLNIVAPVTSSVPATTVLPVSPATVNLFDEIASDRVASHGSVRVACHISVLDSVAAPELRLLNVVAPVTSSVPATTVLPVLPATACSTIATSPLFTSTSPATSSVLDSVAAPELRLLNVVAPVTSSVLDVASLPSLLNVVAPVTSSVPAVLPVLPAT